jgi:hypothetical protein
MKGINLADRAFPATTRRIVAKNTTPAAAAIQRASEVTAAPGVPAAGEGSGRTAKCPVQVFTAGSDWRITTGRTAQQRSEINPSEGGSNHE